MMLLVAHIAGTTYFKPKDIWTLKQELKHSAGQEYNTARMPGAG